MKVSDLLWKLPKEVSVDLLMELRDGMPDANKVAFDQRVERLFATREDRSSEWQDENADALEARRRKTD